MSETLLSGYPDVLTPSDLQEILPVGRTAIYKLISNGEIKSKKIGKKIIITKSHLLDFLLSA